MTERPVAQTSNGLILLGAAFLTVQLYLILFLGYGPFRDEAFYITAGLEFWRGEPYDAGRYLDWFNGSPYAWPIVAGGMFRFGELAGARLGALLCVAGSIALAFDATRRLVGRAAAVAGVVVVLAKGSTQLLAHYATYDVLAFAFLAFAFWCVARWRDAADWRWAALAGLGVWAAAMSKYPYAAMGLPLVALVVTHRETNRVRDAAILTVCAAAPFLLGVQTQFGTWIPPTLRNYDHATFPAWLVVAATLGLVATPLAAASYGLVSRSTGPAEDRDLARLLWAGLGTLLMWVVLHVASGQIASSFKHLWIGTLLALPAVGYGADLAWRRLGTGLRATGIVLLVSIGIVEWAASERLTYPNFRSSVEFILENSRPDEAVYVVGDNDRWVYAMYLYHRGRVGSPLDIVDQVARGDEVCEHEWVVATRTTRTGAADTAGWGCEYDLAFESRQRFLNYRGEFDTQTSRVWKRTD